LGSFVAMCKSIRLMAAADGLSAAPLFFSVTLPRKQLRDDARGERD